MRREMERDGILAVLGAGNRLSDAVMIFNEMGEAKLAHDLDDVLANLSKLTDTIPSILDARTDRRARGSR